MKKFIIRILKYFGLKSYAKELLRKVNFTKRITINQKEFLVPHIYGSGVLISETWMLIVLERLFEVKKGLFMDVGVNLGQTFIEVKSIDINRKYLGFEPNPACVFYVEELVLQNKFNNCKIIPVGLYFEDTILSLDLYADDITNSGGSVIKNFWDY